MAAVLVIAVFGSIFASCFWPSDSPEEEYSVTGVVTGLSPYNQPKLDVRADDIFEQGITLGALFDIQAGDRVFEDAILLGNYLGMFMFDKFVNVESDGYLSIGCVGKLISVPEGSEVTLTYSGDPRDIRRRLYTMPVPPMSERIMLRTRSSPISTRSREGI